MATEVSALAAYREQIAANICFFSGRRAQVDIVTARTPLGEWKVYAVKTGSGKREVVICESADTLQQAFDRLLVKSAEALHNYVSANGFGPVKSVKTRTLGSEDDSADSDASHSTALGDSEIITVCKSSPSDSSPSDSDDDFVMAREKVKSRRRKSHRKSRVPSTRGSRDGGDSGSESDVSCMPRKRASPGPVTFVPLVPTITARSHPPPPPPNWTPGPRHYQPPPAPVSPMNQQLPPPPAHYKAAAPATSVALAINWIGHGEIKVVEPCRPSLRSLLDTALNYVRSHHTSFKNVAGPDMAPSKLWSLRASVKRVCLGKTMYHISSLANDDITALFNASDVPLFEIDVDFPMTPIITPPQSQR